MAHEEAENFASTTYQPVYYIVDDALLGELTAGFQAVLFDEENIDFLQITRDDIDAGGKGKKAPPKKDSEVEEEEDCDVTVNEGMLTAIKELITKECARRQDMLYAKRKALVDEVNGKADKKAPKKGGKGKGKKNDEQEEEEKVTSLPSSYPATLPLHIQLDGIIKKVGDVEKLLEADVLLNSIVLYKTTSKPKDTKIDPEFQYGNPLGSTDENSIAPADDAKVQQEKAAAELQALFAEILGLREANEVFADLGTVEVAVPKALTERKQGDGASEAGSRPSTSTSKKGGKKGKKAADDGQSDFEVVFNELSVASMIAVRQFSQDLQDFAAWREDAKIKVIDEAKAPDTVDLRLYDNLMSAVPDSCTSVPLLLHCMFEQVAASVSDQDLQPMFTNKKIDKLESYLDDALSMILATKMTRDDDIEEDAPPADVWGADWENEKLTDEGFGGSKPAPIALTEFSTMGKQDEEPAAKIRQQQRSSIPADIPVANEFAHTKEFCPATMGEQCQYDDNNVCPNCLMSQASPVVGEPAFALNATKSGFEFCPATMGEVCDYDNGVCRACGGIQEQSRPGSAGEFASVAPDVPIGQEFTETFDLENTKPETRLVTEAKPKRKVYIRPLSTTVLKYGDNRRINQALSCLEVGKSWEEFRLTDEVDEITTNIKRPGVSRAGMPDSSAISVVERGITRTEMLNKSALPAEIFERGLLNLTLEQMLESPAPTVDFCLTSGTEFFFVDHLYRESKIVEQKVDLKLAELREAAARGETTGQSIGVPDEIVEEARIKWDWQLGNREYREEIAAEILPQVLASAMNVTDSVHTQARYEPLDDSLLIVMHARTPLTRRRTVSWKSFLCPQMNFSTWVDKPVGIKKMKPDLLYGFNNGHTGELHHTATLMYPRDGARAGLTTTKSGTKTVNTVWVQKDSELLYLRGKGAADPASNLLNVTFNDKSFMCIRCGKDGDMRPTFTFTTQSGLLISISADGKVYMSNPSEVAAFKRKADTSDGAAAAQDKSKVGVGKQGEEWRCLKSNGVVVKKMLDSSSKVLLPDANVSTYDEAAGAWTTTNNQGQHVRTSNDNDDVELVGAVDVATQIDPESGATVVTRDDLTMTIRYRDGSTLSQHADGTRIYTDKFPRPDKKRHLVECPDFPPVTFDVEKKVSLGGMDNVVPRTGSTGRNLRSLERQTGKVEKRGGLTEMWDVSCQINLFDGTVIKKRAPQGGVIVSRDGARFVCCPNGKVVYVPKTLPTEKVPSSLGNCEYEEHGIPAECYTFDMLDGTLKLHDLEDNKFEASLSGEWDTKLSREQGAGASAGVLHAKFFPPPENPIQPRIFVVRGDGSGAELLSPLAIKAYLDSVSRNPRCRQLPAEPLDGEPGADRVNNDNLDMTEIDGHAPDVKQTLSFKFLESLPVPHAYTRKPIIPDIVKAAPNVFTADDKPRHNFIVYRHLIRTPRLTDEQRQQVIVEKKAYQDWKADQAKHDLDFLTEDPRPAEEIEEEKRLQVEVMTARARRKERELSSTLQGHDTLANSSAREEIRPPSTPKERANLAATIPSMYEPPKRVPVTTVPLTQTGDDGTIEPIKFFNKPNSRKGTKSNRKTRSEAPANRTSKSKKSPELGPFFKNPVFGQRFSIQELLQALKAQCNPLYKDGMSEENLDDAMADLSAGEREVKANEHFQKISSVVEGINQLVALVSRIFKRPHDPTLRTINLAQPPYEPILASSDIVAMFAEPILETLGFEKNGILVLMKDDLFVKDGVRSLVHHLTGLVSRAIEEPVVDEGGANGGDESDNEEGGTDYRPKEEPVQRSRAYMERESRMKATLAHPPVHGRQTFNYEKFTNDSFNPPEPKAPLEQFGVPTGTLNVNYINRETAVKRPTKTSSTVARVSTDPTAPFTDFEFTPSHINMGELRMGKTYRMTCSLANVGVEPGKFRVDCPHFVGNHVLETNFRPGPLAAGMKKQIDVQIFTGEEGDYATDLRISTEKAIFSIPITGRVVSEERPDTPGRKHHLPALEPSSKRRGRFGKVGKVRLYCEGPTSRVAQLLAARNRGLGAKVAEPDIPSTAEVELDPSRTLEQVKDEANNYI